MMYDNYAPNESPPALLNLLRTWGEAVFLKMCTKITKTIADRGVPCMMVG